jgi:hypothetical protein
MTIKKMLLSISLFSWALLMNSIKGNAQHLIQKNLIVDLSADKGVITNDSGRVEKWLNQVGTFGVKEFVKRDEGRKIKGSGMPLLKKKLNVLNHHNTISFIKQELVADNENAFDHLITGSGYTWFCVLKAGKQAGDLKDVNSFFGNLRNEGNYEGFWGGLKDNNSIWMGSRNGITFGRWDHNNPCVTGGKILKPDQYYLLVGRMGQGNDMVTLSLYINDIGTPVASSPFHVNKLANASKLAIGQERDAIQHPGVESFIGEISRFLLYDCALTDKELCKMAKNIRKKYHILN